VEADGEWHTSDDKYASDAWRQAHKRALPPPSPTPHLKRQATSSSPSAYIRDGSTQGLSQKLGDVVVLDSEEEDEGEVKRELSPSLLEQSPMNGFLNSQVIDLTAESDEESATSRSLGTKRKAEDDSVTSSEDIWKKSRIGDSPNATTMTQAVNGNVNIPTSSVLVSGSNNHGARRYAMNTTPLQHRPHSTQFAPVTHVGSPYATATYRSHPSRMATASSGASGPFGHGHQVSHRAGYYSQYGNG
jgi:E3 SUMO-protein ligase PIAS1